MQKENLLTEDQKMILHHWPAITSQVNAVDFLRAIGEKIQAQVKETHDPENTPKDSGFIVITTEALPEGFELNASTCGTPVLKARVISCLYKQLKVKKVLKKARKADKSKLPDAMQAFRDHLMEKLKEVETPVNRVTTEDPFDF